MALVTHHPDPVAPAPGVRPLPARRRIRLPGGALLGVVPFFAYVVVFLAIPTLVVAIGAFTGDSGGFTLDNVARLGDSYILTAFGRSILLSAVTALVGAVLGALLGYALVTAKPDGLLRRVVTAASGVLAQFGGVTLAFAFIATIGLSGFVTEFLRDRGGVDIYASGVWLFELPGLLLVYTYFQIPLMVIVFLPALEGLRPQWREAAVNLGATTRQYWTQVGFPLLLPAFLGSMLLLFANAFAAYATAAALVSQGSPITPLLIRSALTSETLLGQSQFGYALALEMVVVVALVMGAYGLLLRRAARWLQ